MRERFLAGEDVTGGVRPEVLLSWYRCRDDYAVDPFQERAPSAPEREPSQLLEEKVVLSELAGVAKSIEPEVEALGALVAITDGRGGIVAAWGDRSTLRRADDANLTARCAWSERGAGTNGMGTALVSEGPIIFVARSTGVRASTTGTAPGWPSGIRSVERRSAHSMSRHPRRHCPTRC